MTVGQMPPMKQRFALVGRDASTFIMEMSMEGPMIPTGGKATIRVLLDANENKADRVKKVIMQLGDGDPMEMPSAGASMPKGQFGKVDPKKLVGAQEIKVAAGTFKTKHYRDATTSGETFDYWVNEDVMPFGLVKLEGDVKAVAGGPGGPVTMQLAARGRDAKPTVTKPAQPFNPAMMMGQMGGGGPGGPRGAGGPPRPRRP